MCWCFTTASIFWRSSAIPSRAGDLGRSLKCTLGFGYERRLFLHGALCLRAVCHRAAYALRAEEMRIDMKAVVFDMDGVLFDTERVCMESWLAVAAQDGLPDMDKIFPRCIGGNANDSRKIVLEAYGQDFDYDTFREKASVRFWEEIEEKGLPMMAGVREILEWLKEEEWIVGLASSTKRSSVLDHLGRAGIRDYFQAIVTGDMVAHSKPLPDIYLIACRHLGIEPCEAYAIEDSPNGIRSAYAAGMCPLMVPDMLQPDQEIRHMSYRIFKDLTEVLEFMKCNAGLGWR